MNSTQYELILETFILFLKSTFVTFLPQIQTENIFTNVFSFSLTIVEKKELIRET